MLEALKGKASDRKLRLFACGCCRAVWAGLTFDRGRQAVAVAERYADGLATDADLHRARSLACDAGARLLERMGRARLVRRGRDGLSLEEGRLLLAGQAAHHHKPFLIGRLRWLRFDDELKGLAPALLRCIFGNPFETVAAVPPCVRTWNGGTVVGLAEGVYADRLLPAGTFRPDRVAVLADALEEAGCQLRDLLAHLRSPGGHWRGCWAVDCLLGRG
jgi:hypothetical protein